MRRYLNTKLTSRNLLSLIIVLSFSCDEDSGLPCIKGKYLGQYCDGAVIQILDGHNIGKDWDSIFDDKHYENSVLASVDTALTKQGHFPDAFVSIDSVFYFHYIDGGYARKQYSNCQPTPFITITFAIDISTPACKRYM